MSKLNVRGLTESSFYCTQCGKKTIPIFRSKGREREPSHLKDMWCPYCNKDTKFVEIRPFSSDYNYDDFVLEYIYHNFNEDGTRKQPYRQFRVDLYKKGLL